MATDRQLEEFIGDSFSSIWDLELLGVLLDHTDLAFTQEELVQRMRSSELVVSQGAQALRSAGLASIDAQGRLQFCPIDREIETNARSAREFYKRFPGRTRRLIVARQAPGLNAFADAFRLRKDRP